MTPARIFVAPVAVVVLAGIVFIKAWMSDNSPSSYAASLRAAQRAC
jgi:hypothetical protein